MLVLKEYSSTLSNFSISEKVDVFLLLDSLNSIFLPSSNEFNIPEVAIKFKEKSFLSMLSILQVFPANST